MLSFLAFGTLWFWLIIGAFIVFELIFADNEMYGAATLAFVAFTLLMFLGNGGLLAFLIANPLAIVAVFVSYLGLGVAWSFYKWRNFVKEKLEEAREFRLNFLLKNGVEDATTTTPIPESLRDLWNGKRDTKDGEWFDSYNYSRSCLRPKALNHKSRIIGWMSYWPFQLIASLIRDPFIALYKTCVTLFDRISVNIYGDDAADFK